MGGSIGAMELSITSDILDGQAADHVCGLLLAFLLTALIGLERNLRGKGAGLRTQSIVGVSSALFLLVSKYGFFDLLPLLGGEIRLDPSRVASQIVSGVGFLGAGLIVTQHSRTKGLTTAASIWESAAIGTAAGAGLWVLATAVTVLHFAITFGFSWIERQLPRSSRIPVRLNVVYQDGRGLLRTVLETITRSGWSVSRAEPKSHTGPGQACLHLELEGPDSIDDLVVSVSGIDGLCSVEVIQDDDLE